MDVKTGRRLNVDERREQLLELGKRAFSNASFDDVSMEAIADQAGVSKGLLYHYFPGKRPFYIAAIRAVSDELLTDTEPDWTSPLPDALDQSLRAFFAFVRRRDRLYRALVRGGIGSDAEVEEIVEEVRRESVARLMRLIGVELPPPTASLAAYAWVGSVECLALAWLDQPAVPEEEVLRLARSNLELVIQESMNKRWEWPS